jgi:hypothetical protein
VLEMEGQGRWRLQQQEVAHVIASTVVATVAFICTAGWSTTELTTPSMLGLPQFEQVFIVQVVDGDAVVDIGEGVDRAHDGVRVGQHYLLPIGQHQRRSVNICRFSFPLSRRYCHVVTLS